MRPMIDQMFRGTNHPPPPTPHPPPTDPTSLLKDIAAASFNASPRVPPITTCSTTSGLKKLLDGYRCVVINFTNERGCPPCRTLAPVYESLASEFTPNSDDVPMLVGQKRARQAPSKSMAFVKVDTTMSVELASAYSIRATPTLKFFVDGKEVRELVFSSDDHSTALVVAHEFTGF